MVVVKCSCIGAALFSVLELTTPARVAERLEEDEVSLTHLTDSIGRKQETTIINESGLYSVILRSDKPQAKPFRKWVTGEVLPSIRKHGAYMTSDVLGRPTVHIKCEECRTRSDWNVFNCGRWNSEAGTFLHYDEQQAIADTCRKWNIRKATP